MTFKEKIRETLINTVDDSSLDLNYNYMTEEVISDVKEFLKKIEDDIIDSIVHRVEEMYAYGYDKEELDFDCEARDFVEEVMKNIKNNIK